MKHSLLTAIVLLGATTASAQTSIVDPLSLVSDYGGASAHTGYHASTALEGFTRGLADLARSQGVANALDAQGQVSLSIAEKQFIENRGKRIQQFWDARQLWREQTAMERGPRHGPDFYTKLSRIEAPARLTPAQLDSISGRISWPILLRTDTNLAVRAELERLFVNRSVNGGMSAEEYLQVSRLTAILINDLQNSVAALPPQQYVVAKRFVQSLAFEASLPPV